MGRVKAFSREISSSCMMLGGGGGGGEGGGGGGGGGGGEGTAGLVLTFRLTSSRPDTYGYLDCGHILERYGGCAPTEKFVYNYRIVSQPLLLVRGIVMLSLALVTECAFTNRECYYVTILCTHSRKGTTNA